MTHFPDSNRFEEVVTRIQADSERRLSVNDVGEVLWWLCEHDAIDWEKWKIGDPLDGSPKRGIPVGLINQSINHKTADGNRIFRQRIARLRAALIAAGVPKVLVDAIEKDGE